MDFDSLDRYQVEQEPPTLVRWSTPLYPYGHFDGHRLATGGEARWGDPGQEWTYGDFCLTSIRYNVHLPLPRSATAESTRRLPQKPDHVPGKPFGFIDVGEVPTILVHEERRIR